MDSEIRRVIEAAESRARTILTENRGDLDALADALLEYETLSADDVRHVLAGEPLDREINAPPRAGSVPASGPRGIGHIHPV